MSVLSLFRGSLCLSSHWSEVSRVCPFIGQWEPIFGFYSFSGNLCCYCAFIGKGTIVCASISIFYKCCQECPLLHLVLCPSLSAQLVLVCVVDVVVDGVPQASVRSDRVVVQLAPQVVLGLLQLHYLVPQLCQLGVQSFLLLCQLHLV